MSDLATMHGPLPEMQRGGDGPFLLSRFACIRRVDETLVVESPLSPTRVQLHDWRAFALIDALRRPVHLAEDLPQIPALPVEDARALLVTLRDAGMLTGVTPDGRAEDEQGSLQSWEFHDLLFHGRTRFGRTGTPLGGTYRFAGAVDPPPALADRATAEQPISLAEPDLDRLHHDDRPLAWVQDARLSVRHYGDPLTVVELGEFLYRIARVVDYSTIDLTTHSSVVGMDFASRPYPAAGGLYELEPYIAVKACAGVDPGLYRYDGRDHRLHRLSATASDVDELLAGGARSAGIRDETVQVLVILAARFARVAWKYESIAYSLMLKNVGVMLDTMYLVATAMGLAPCALGAGDSDLFARAAGTDYYAETSVGEFLLGRP